MPPTDRCRQRLFLGLLAASLCCGAAALAQGKPENGDHVEPVARQEPTDFFSALENKRIRVCFVAHDEKHCSVRVGNTGQRPIELRLPPAFVGEPVTDNRFGKYRRRTQAVGGGFYYEPPELMARDDDGAFLCVPAGETVELKVTTVCLDPGLPEPRPDLPYEIKPIESCALNPAVQELCRMLSQPTISQKAAQAAAWHLDDGVRWAVLAAMRTRTPNGRSIPMFPPSQIRMGKKLATRAVKLAVQRRKQAELAARRRMHESP